MSNFADQVQQVTTGFEVGQRFPNLVLPTLSDIRPPSMADHDRLPPSMADHDRLPRSLADFRGQKIILHIFASW